MKYELSEHALIRIRERKIETAWLEQAIIRPQKTKPDEDDPALEQNRPFCLPHHGRWFQTGTLADIRKTEEELRKCG